MYWIEMFCQRNDYFWTASFFPKAPRFFVDMLSWFARLPLEIIFAVYEFVYVLIEEE